MTKNWFFCLLINRLLSFLLFRVLSYKGIVDSLFKNIFCISLPNTQKIKYLHTTTLLLLLLSIIKKNYWSSKNENIQRNKINCLHHYRFFLNYVIYIIFISESVNWKLTLGNLGCLICQLPVENAWEEIQNGYTK